MAGVPGMPSAAPMEDAGPGNRRSLDPLATRMKPICCAAMPALEAILGREQAKLGDRLVRRRKPPFGDAGHLQQPRFIYFHHGRELRVGDDARGKITTERPEVRHQTRLSRYA
jgi:hypothetical protein